MKLRFNKGAVVTFSLVGNPQPNVISGKVLAVLEDEVQLCPQCRINFGFEWDKSRSADSTTVVHINRQFISSWRYSTLSDFSGFSDLSINITDEAFATATLNHYNVDGYCTGDGEYLGDVEEHYPSSLIIFSGAENEDNGHKMEMSIF